ncbi:MAG: hypothetical protein AABZ74_14515 [Cyanobacteriota bacterium]
MKFFKLFIISLFLFSKPSFAKDCPKLVINEKIKYGSLVKNKFVERKNKTFKNAEIVVMPMIVQNFSYDKKTYNLKINADIKLSYKGREISTMYNIFGMDGKKLFIADKKVKKLRELVLAEFDIHLTIPSEIKGEITANIKIKDMNEKCRTGNFSTKLMIN